MKRKQGKKLARPIGTIAATAVMAGACAGVANAQHRHEMMEQLLAPLTPASRATVERLMDLNTFPAEDWRYHVGDLPHGESMDLSDASWQVVNAKSEAPADAVWYRKQITVPASFHGYDSTGTKISFRFEFSSDTDVPEIVYVNGKRVALGADLEPIALTENAKPGETFLVAVKLLASAGPKTFRGAELIVDYPSNRPSPSDLVQQELSAAILIPSMSKNPTADMELVNKSLAAVDLKALGTRTHADEAAFDASLTKALAILDPLKPMLQQATFHETGNSHIDAAWLWPWTETVDTVHRTFGTAAQLIHEYPGYTFTQSAAQYNEWMADKYPELNDEIKKDIQAGRWEVVGGMWVEPDLNLPSGENTVRSILLGKRWYMQHYGVDVHIGWNPDSFGYDWQLPQMYARSGIDTFVTQKMSWNDTNQLPFKLFWWQSPDGSKVLTYFPHDYGNRDLGPVRLSMDLAAAQKDAPGMLEMMDLFGVGDHGGGPTRAMLDQGEHWANGDYVAPKLKFGTSKSYFDAVRPLVDADTKTWDYKSIAQGYTYPPAPPEGKISIPTWNDELYLEFHRGVYTTQAGQKRNIRDGEIEALDAEKVASLAWLDGSTYPNTEFTDAWEKITFNGFHDLAAGSGIAVIYRDAQKQFDVVRRETSEISQASLQTMAAAVDTSKGDGVPVFVWNPLAWERTGTLTFSVQMPKAEDSVSVVDAAGKVLPSEVVSSDAKTNTFKVMVRAEDVPSLGYTVLHVIPGKKDYKTDLKADGLTLENDRVKVVVDPQTGCITSLYNKRDSFETIAPGGCGNELQAFHDNPKDYDAWNIDPGTLDVPPMKIDTAESVKLVQQNGLRDVIEVKRKWQSSTFTQWIMLDAGADHAVVKTDVDWHESHILLKAAFPLAATNTYATYEIPYGSIERPTTRNNSFEKARFEVPALKWADEGDAQHGFSLINDSKYGYDGVGNLLRLSLLRSPKSPDPNADMGMQEFSYALYPHAGGWQQAETVQHGYNFNYPMTAMQVEPHTGSMPASHSFATVDAPNVLLTAMKKAEDSNALIVRMYEYAGKETQLKVKVPAGATGAMETNLMEKQDGPQLPMADGMVSVGIHPYEILTLKVNYNR